MLDGKTSRTPFSQGNAAFMPCQLFLTECDHLLYIQHVHGVTADTTMTFGLVWHLQGDESMCMASRQTPLRRLAWFGISRATSELYRAGGHRYEVGKGCASPG
jgi:hypothetical protein